MSRLMTILETHAAEAGNLGGASAKLLDALRAYCARLRKEFVVVVIVVTVVVSYAAYAINHFADPDKLTAYNSLLGMSVGGILEILRRVWRDWGRTTLLIALLENATEADVSAIVAKLIAEL